ncbi:MAG TPA: hypothetical protein VF534_31020 [Paraburkholderia sp.]
MKRVNRFAKYEGWQIEASPTILARQRLDEMKDGSLRMPVTSGPVFVLLALPLGYEESVQPVYGDCDAAAEALCLAQPGGYVIAKRGLRDQPPRTFGSDYPDGMEARFTYVHVSEHGMVDIVAGEIAANRYQSRAYGALVGRNISAVSCCPC